MGEEFNEILPQLETWYSHETGRYLLQQIETHLGRELETAFGYHLAQVGISRRHPLYAGSRIRHCIYSAPAGGDSVALVAESDQLPLASDSVDVVIAHHALEFSDNPHQALREMHRVLTPQGHLFVIGFNPYSVPGSWLRLRAMAGSALWQHRRSLSRSRLHDWFNLLGLESEDSAECFALPPFGRGRLRRAVESVDRCACALPLPLGGVYILHALKQVPGHLRPAQRARRARLIDLAVPKPVPSPRPTPREAEHAA